MAKNIIDNIKDGRYVGPTVKLTPNDKTGTPDSFEKLYERREKQARRVQPATAPPPKLNELDNPSLADRMETLGISEN